MSPSVVPGENNGLLRSTTIHNIPKQSKATHNCQKKNKKQSKTIRNYPKHSTTTPNNLLLPIVFVNEKHVNERFHWFHDAVQFDFWNGKTFPKSGAFLISTKNTYLESLIQSKYPFNLRNIVHFKGLLCCCFHLVFFVLLCLFLKQLHWKSMVLIRIIFLSFQTINCVGPYLGLTLFIW